MREHSQAFGTAPTKTHVRLGFVILHKDCDYHNGWGKQALLSPRSMELLVVVQLLQHPTLSCDCSGQLHYTSTLVLLGLLSAWRSPLSLGAEALAGPQPVAAPIQHPSVKWSCEMAWCHLQQMSTNILSLLKQAQLPLRDALWECLALFGMPPSVHPSAGLTLIQLHPFRVHCVVLCPLKSQYLHSQHCERS